MSNDVIGEVVGVVEALMKTQKRRLSWYGQVMSREESRCKEDAGSAGCEQETQGKTAPMRTRGREGA